MLNFQRWKTKTLKEDMEEQVKENQMPISKLARKKHQD